MAAQAPENRIIWVSRLNSTNMAPYYSLTIPKRAWEKITTNLTHGMQVGFVQGGYGLIYEGKLKLEKGGKIRVVGAGWRDIVEAKGYQQDTMMKFEITRSDEEEIIISCETVVVIVE